MNCNVSLCSLYLLQDLEPSQFSLIEVLLDRGVAERVLERDEKPWKLIQQTRKVGLLNYHLALDVTKIVSEYDQEILLSQTADNPVASRGRAAQPSRDTRKTK